MVTEPQPSASNQNNNKNTPTCNIGVLETEKKTLRWRSFKPGFTNYNKKANDKYETKEQQDT
jgi:hypothetical protein